MRSNNESYDIAKSSERIDNILSTNIRAYPESPIIPTHDKLNYTNGYYIDVGALFIDIRDSKGLTDVHRRPTLSKLYRCFVSECVAVINSNPYCKEVNIHGDCVWGVFEGMNNKVILEIFNTAARLKSLTDLLNYKFEINSIQKISVGIGLDCGRALMVQAGFKGTGLNEVIWTGDVVNQACYYANLAGKTFNNLTVGTLVINNNIFDKLGEHDKTLLKFLCYDEQIPLYHGNVIMTSMNDWIRANCK